MTEQFRSVAHGRVNLIGEHTDYNGGWVLPTAIPQQTEIVLTKRSSLEVTVKSSLQREESYLLGEERPRHSWIDYFQGATHLLKDQPLSGFLARVTSDVPEGGGLSSSAALEMSLLKVLRIAFDLKLTDVELAKIGQRIENEFVGAHVGIMDQMATSLAESGEALFLDTLTLNFERVKLPMEKMDLLVINSGISHRLSTAGGGYNERRAQCEQACRLLRIPQLRNISPTELERKDLPELLHQRARHVVTENVRVHEAVAAIKKSDLSRLGELFVASHISLRDDYEVSIPEIDLLVDLCLVEKDVFGARLTGGGFGGSIVAITRKGCALDVASRVLPQYRQKTGEEARVIVGESS